MKQSAFEQWIATLNDRALEQQWLIYCASSENPTTIINPDRACVVYEAMIARGLL